MPTELFPFGERIYGVFGQNEKGLEKRQDLPFEYSVYFGARIMISRNRQKDKQIQRADLLQNIE